MTGFAKEADTLLRNELAACERVIRSGSYILGSEVEHFEQLWAERCRSRYAVGVGNGMDAIEIALRALGVGAGDEVITTAMTAFATVLAILRAGATPVLADISANDALLDPESAQRCLTPRTKGILLVHLYGRIAPMNQWRSFCDEHNLLLIEDCAQSHLAMCDGKFAGTFGAAGAFSFYPTKNLGAVGDGGALVTNSEEIAAKAKRLRHYGQSVRYYHTELGLNSRLDELQAAILRARLDWLEQFTKRRREIAALYYSGIRHPRIELLVQPSSQENHVYHLFVVRCEDRQRLMSHLEVCRIASSIHYPLPIHEQELTCHLDADPAGLRHSENHAATCLSIPCHPQMKDGEVNRVIDALNSFA